MFKVFVCLNALVLIQIKPHLHHQQLNILAVGLIISVNKMFKVFPCMGTRDALGRASMNPSCLIGRIYVLDH